MAASASLNVRLTAPHTPSGLAQLAAFIVAHKTKSTLLVSR